MKPLDLHPHPDRRAKHRTQGSSVPVSALRAFLLFLLGTGLAAAKPNIIFVIADDLGYGDLGSYGQKTIQTPVLDKLAADGIRFTQHYSGCTVCAPSRSALMTGLDTGSTW
jgi:membrane-anchored protein YejM (alkaline phosphatase superfamily)